LDAIEERCRERGVTGLRSWMLEKLELRLLSCSR
jgi:hypothetical protein